MRTVGSFEDFMRTSALTRHGGASNVQTAKSGAVERCDEEPLRSRPSRKRVASRLVRQSPEPVADPKANTGRPPRGNAASASPKIETSAGASNHVSPMHQLLPFLAVLETGFRIRFLSLCRCAFCTATFSPRRRLVTKRHHHRFSA